MIKPVDNIVIVGGGSSGWITAAMLVKQFPQKKITVIESPDVPTVGVGESTLGQFKTLCLFLELDEYEFMRKTDASYKMSIQFTDFYEKDSGSFHYPFGTPFEKSTIRGMNDWLYKKIFYPDTPITDFVDCFFPAAALFNNNKFSLNKNGEFDNYTPVTDVAYHFDAIKFANYLRQDYCKPRGVKHVQATVVDAKINDDGIEKLILNNGEEVVANLFIDCTGFKSLLIGEYLKQTFTDYSHILPNNRAWACQVPYKNKELELQAFTNCTAIGHGWVWNTPVWSRLGTGYVYSDKFISPEDAKEEFKQYLMSNKMVIPRTREEVDQLKFKDVPMRIGSYKKTFVKNVVAIGLSAAFIEPLESNGLLTVHEWVFYLMRLLTRPAITQYDKDAYNTTTFNHWESFANFVAHHYALSIRTDTEYWRSNFNRSLIDENLKNGTETKFVTQTLAKRFEDGFINPTNPIDGRNWITTGMNWMFFDFVLYNKNEASIEYATGKTNRNEIERIFRLFERRKQKWLDAASKCPTLYEYQRQNIFHQD